MLQGTLHGKPFIVNAMMKLDSAAKEQGMVEWSSERDCHTNMSSLKMQSFYTDVFVKYGDSECLVNLENGVVRGTAQTELVIKPIKGNSCAIPMYGRDICSGGCSIKAGPIVLYAKIFQNKQLRSEIAISGAGSLENADGFVIRPMRTKVCRVKKLTDSKLITMKKSSYKGETTERFYTSADKTGVIRSIPKM